MIPRTIFRRTIHAVLASTLLSVLASSTAADDSYVESISKHRSTIDAEFSDSETSPLPDADIETFTGLSYFPVDPSLRMTARFETARDTATFRMPSFDNEFIDFAKYGHLTYVREGVEVRLTLFQRMDIGDLGTTFALIPFRDGTNGETTYPGGRYIELTLPLSDPPVVDFNLASSPYCAYDDGFSCPIPPKENWLDFPIPAGEMAYH